MNDTEKRYLYFYVKNYSGTFSTSGYTLPISPFTFIPVLDDAVDANISNTNIYWDFGDGTISRDVTATHHYTIPGIYNVSCFFLTNSGRGFESTFRQSISVKDFYSDSLILSASTDKINTASHIDTTFLLSRINSWQSYSPSNDYSIMLYVSGEGAPLLDVNKYGSDKFAHLKPSSRFLAYKLNNATGENELIPVNSITTSSSPLYACVSGSDIVACESTMSGAAFAGTSGQQIFYFTDDDPSPTMSIVAYFDSRAFKDKDNMLYNNVASTYPILHQANTATYSLSFSNNQIPSHLSITSNGIDGENTGVTSFNISTEKYVNQYISFIVKVKDIDNFTIKSLPVLGLVDFNSILKESTVYICLINSNGDRLPGVLIEANLGVLSSEEYGGYIRCKLRSTRAYDDVRIYAQSLADGVLVTGVSNTFSIYSDQLHSIGKVNENFNAASQLQSFVFQDTFQDYSSLFKDFLGTALGDDTSSPTYLGKKVYERIANFTSNLASVDTCSIEALRSMHNMLGEDFYAFHRFNFNYPAEVSRLIELFSIRFSKLKGGRNTHSRYFLDRGYSNYDVKYGKNRGKELDILSTILTAGSASRPIVAYEKFSEQYTILNTDILSSADTGFINPVSKTYALSAFNKWWGWELVLPPVYTIYDIQKYYKFYEYVESTDDTQLEGVINWNDPYTTLNEYLSSADDWDNIRESMLSHALIKAMLLSRVKDSEIIEKPNLPPSITTHPTPLYRPVGAGATFSVAASGSNPLSYQWYKNGVLIPGATSSVYKIAVIPETGVDNYNCVANNLYGSAISNSASLTTGIAPAITTHPLSQLKVVGENVSFNVIATGDTPLSYQWYKDGIILTGATSNTLTLNSVNISNNGNYYCIVTNIFSATKSNDAVFAAGLVPTIITHPISQFKAVGGNASLSVIATGTTPLSYQWYKDSIILTGATSNILTLNSVNNVNDGTYRCVVTNAFGNITSNNAVLTIGLAPTIITHPISQIKTVGSSATLNVVAGGAVPLSYQWYKDSAIIVNATSNTLILNSVNNNTNGNYYCVVTNVFGNAVSNNALLTIGIAPAISVHPLSQAVAIGSTVLLSVVAAGTTPLSYQWYKDSIILTGTTSNILTLNSVSDLDLTSYYCVVTNIFGNITSNTAVLTRSQMWFDDTSSTPNEVTLNGEVVQTNDGIGIKYATFNGTNSYLSLENSPDYDLPGDFTVEFFAKMNATGQQTFVINGAGASHIGLFCGWSIRRDDSEGKLNFCRYDSSKTVELYAFEQDMPADGSWHHIAASRANGVLRLFFDGTLSKEYNTTTQFNKINTTDSLKIGYARYQSGQHFYLNGSVVGLRIVKGTALYTQSFTLPTTLPTDITGTQLLLNFEATAISRIGNWYDDTSSIRKLVTLNSIVTQNDEGNGIKSAKFNNNSNLLISHNTAFNFENGDFTVEMFIKFISFNNRDSTFITTASPIDITGFGIACNSSGNIVFCIGDASSSNWNTILTASSNPCVVGQWTHVAVVRNNNTFTVYKDGVSVINFDSSLTLNNLNNSIVIGGRSVANQFTNSEITGVRIVKGTALYTNNFTVPTTIPVNVAGTELLLNFESTAVPTI